VSKLILLCKLLSVLALAAGTWGGVAPSSHEDRQRAVYGLATPAFFFTWLFGYVMMKQGGYSMGAPWISASLLTSLGSLVALSWVVERDRPAPLAATLAVLGLGATVALMVIRPEAA
jgi:peptidoglycan/LPS O-acetylase OafA/YrhL